jgi:hypothetical protein
LIAGFSRLVTLHSFCREGCTRISSRTVKDLRDQLESDDDMLRGKMSELVSLRKIVADGEIEGGREAEDREYLLRARSLPRSSDMAQAGDVSANRP